jgi:hypothetical protein
MITSLDLFTVAPALTELNVSLFVPRGVFPGMVIHRGIKSLTGDTGDDLIQYLTLPALQSLHIYSTTSYGSLESFLARSSPPRASLTCMDIRSDRNLASIGYVSRFWCLAMGISFLSSAGQNDV